MTANRTATQLATELTAGMDESYLRERILLEVMHYDGTQDACQIIKKTEALVAYVKKGTV